MVNKDEQTEEELDKLLLLLSKPLTRLILSVLDGKDPDRVQNKLSRRTGSSENSHL
ncbi:MAG: hypothetical protein ACXACD_07150 [Candidatus Thorarchaeota archaeon]|jgi:hypothetical protein